MVNFAKVDKIREIARTNIEDLFSTTIDSIVEKAFEFEGKRPDEYLISTHFAFREILNETKAIGRLIEDMEVYVILEKFLTTKEQDIYYKSQYKLVKMLNQ